MSETDGSSVERNEAPVAERAETNEHHERRYERRDDRPRRFDDRRDDRRRSSNTLDFRPLEVPVIGGNLEGAIRALKRKMNREGILKQLKLKRFHEKPSVRRKRKRKEAERRRRRLLRRLAKRAHGGGGRGAGRR